jgi:predicted transcriptional regulator
MTAVEYRESDVKYIHSMVEHADPVVTAPELAERVGVTQQAAHEKLQSLRDRGLVNSKKVGSRAVVWWPTSDGLDVYRDTEV